MPEALKPFTAPGLIVPGANTAVFGGDGVLYRAAAGVLTAIGSLRAERTTLAAQYLQLDGGDSTGTRITAEYTSQKFLRINNNGAAGVVTTASIQFALGDVVGLTLVAGDKLLFGSAQDTDLYRAGAGALATTSRLDMLRDAASYGANLINPNASGHGLRVQLGNAAGGGLMVCQSGDTAYRWYVAGDGRMWWGPGGSTAVDTNLYRSAAGVLKTDGQMLVDLALTVNGNALMKNTLTVGRTTIQGGIAAHLVAPTADTYPLVVQGITGQTTDLVRVWNAAGLQVLVTSAGVLQLNNGMTFGTDTNLYRSAADTLKTDDTFVVGTGQSLWAPAINIDHASPKLGFNVTGVAERGFIQYNPATPALRIDSDENIQLAPANTVAITIDNAGKVIFGAALDTQLYRSAANTLRTAGTLIVDGPMQAAAVYSPDVRATVVTKTTNYTVTTADTVVLANGTITITLTSAVGAEGRVYTVKNIHASATATIAAPGGATIDGVASLAIGPKESITVIADGANWWVI